MVGGLVSACLKLLLIGVLELVADGFSYKFGKCVTVFETSGTLEIII